MTKWIPLVASFGLACLMIIPAPGIEGLVIGTVCVLIIIVSAVMMLIDRMASIVVAKTERMTARRRSSRAVHAGSGIAKKMTPPQ